MKEVILLGFKMIFLVGLFGKIDWSLVGAIATIGAIIAAFIIYYLQKSKKRLSYEIISNTQLVGIKNKIQDKIKILYEDKLVENVHLVSIRLINDGNLPIAIDDFATPIRVQLGNNTNILTYEVLEQNPSELNATITRMEDRIEVQPLLLNSNDNFTLNILLNDYDESLCITARIKGVKNIGPYRKSKFTIVNLVLFLYSLLGICAIFGVIYGKETNNDFISNVGFITYVTFMALSLLGLCAGIVSLMMKMFSRD